jgi:hypothetical protein
MIRPIGNTSHKAVITIPKGLPAYIPRSNHGSSKDESVNIYSRKRFRIPADSGLEDKSTSPSY